LVTAKQAIDLVFLAMALISPLPSMSARQDRSGPTFPAPTTANYQTRKQVIYHLVTLKRKITIIFQLRKTAYYVLGLT
jgi:hypothetical protein